MDSLSYDEHAAILSHLRKTFASNKTRSLNYRRQQLKCILQFLDDGEGDLLKALHSDLKKSVFEATCTEIEFTRNAVRGLLIDLNNLAADEYVEKNIITLLDTTFIRREPKGVVLIIGTWNYPLQLTMMIAAGAVAAGNCVVLKPSEFAPKTAIVLQELTSRFLDPDTFRVVLGGVAETTQLLKHRFDHIFFTGSGNVGRIVARAASVHLTPVTLELGGKCPLYMDDSVNLERAVKRMVWGKLVNLGQTCVAPDYVLCASERVKDELIKMIKQVLKDFFADQEVPRDLGCIINDRHYERLCSLLDKTRGDLVIGGIRKPDDKFIDLHVLTNIEPDDPVMEDEIFGPILPLIVVDGPQGAVEYINAREKPLSLYVFTEDKYARETLVSGTSSGTVCVNDVVVQLTVETLPFGGVGNSGYGSYHGKYSFDTFSHLKGVLMRDFGFIGEQLGKFRYPPYNEYNLRTAGMLLKRRAMPTALPRWLINLILVGMGAAIAVAVMSWSSTCK